MITKTRKAINFDLDNNLLKQNYPSKNYKNAWRDIKKYFEDENFIHRQYSGYVSKDVISRIDVIQTVRNMAKYLKWLEYCIKEFDVTIVGDEYSLKNYICYKNDFD